MEKEEKYEKDSVFTDTGKIQDRAEMLKAMDIIVRNLNDEAIIMYWLQCGVPDATTDYEQYCDDDEIYDDIVFAFKYCMHMAVYNM